MSWVEAHAAAATVQYGTEWFAGEFLLRLTSDEFEHLRSQFVISAGEDPLALQSGGQGTQGSSQKVIHRNVVVLTRLRTLGSDDATRSGIQVSPGPPTWERRWPDLSIPRSEAIIVRGARYVEEGELLHRLESQFRLHPELR